jgi:protein AbiQ
MKYVRDLARVDDKVMSVSPQVGKESRPFVGVVVCNQKKCVPDLLKKWMKNAL